MPLTADLRIFSECFSTFSQVPSPLKKNLSSLETSFLVVSGIFLWQVL